MRTRGRAGAPSRGARPGAGAYYALAANQARLPSRHLQGIARAPDVASERHEAGAVAP